MILNNGSMTKSTIGMAVAGCAPWRGAGPQPCFGIDGGAANVLLDPLVLQKMDFVMKGGKIVRDDRKMAGDRGQAHVPSNLGQRRSAASTSIRHILSGVLL